MIQSFIESEDVWPRFHDAVDPGAAAEYRAAGWWGDVTLIDHLRRHARERPAASAYIADDGTLTWAELDAVSSRVGGVICDLGFEPGARIAVLLPDSATVHAVYLGLEKAGAVVVGIGARANGREIAHMLETTGANALITLAEHRGRSTDGLRAEVEALGVSPESHIQVPMFESDHTAEIVVNGRVHESTSQPDFDSRRIGPDDLFLINSTSGTTGLPKCVLHFQNRWLYFHKKAQEHGEFADDEIVMSVVPAPFGFGLFTAHFTPIVLGSPTVAPPQQPVQP